MKALNTDAVRRLYRGKYAPASEQQEINGNQIRGLSFRITLAFATMAAVSDNATQSLLNAVAHDIGLLRDLEREDSFIKGFRCAVELLEKGEVTHAKR
ncbi:hypothetical protein [uncultured Agathobaculum sp.]|uniref:hypothetical protein n=1 Tax=uncultured Agathobaculum sp. TaxID=2048140 RepID=UPI0032090648